MSYETWRYTQTQTQTDAAASSLLTVCCIWFFLFSAEAHLNLYYLRQTYTDNYWLIQLIQISVQVESLTLKELNQLGCFSMQNTMSSGRRSGWGGDSTKPNLTERRHVIYRWQGNNANIIMQSQPNAIYVAQVQTKVLLKAKGQRLKFRITQKGEYGGWRGFYFLFCVAFTSTFSFSLIRGKKLLSLGNPMS